MKIPNEQSQAWVIIKALGTAGIFYAFASLAYNNKASAMDVVAILTAVGTGIFGVEQIKRSIAPKDKR